MGKIFKDNSDLIFLGRNFKDMKAHSEKNLQFFLISELFPWKII